MLGSHEIDRLPFVYLRLEARPGPYANSQVRGCFTSLVSTIRSWASDELRDARVSTNVDGRWRTTSPRRSGWLEALEQQLSDGVAEMAMITVSLDGGRGEVYVTGSVYTGGPRSGDPGDTTGRQAPPSIGVKCLRRTDARRDHATDDWELVEAMVRSQAPLLRISRGWASAHSTENPRLSLLVNGLEGIAAWERPDRLTGYDWVQVIPATAVELLRQAGRDLGAIPAEVVFQVELSDGSAALCCAVRRSPYEVTEADMRQFRAFVLPVLAVIGPPMPGSRAEQFIASGRPADLVPRPGLIAEDWPSAFGGTHE